MTSILSTVVSFDFLMYIMNHIKERTQVESCQECGAVYGDHT